MFFEKSAILKAMFKMLFLFFIKSLDQVEIITYIVHWHAALIFIFQWKEYFLFLPAVSHRNIGFDKKSSYAKIFW